MATTPNPDWRPILKSRLAVITHLARLWTAAIEARLVYLQIAQHGELTARAERQQTRTVDRVGQARRNPRSQRQRARLQRRRRHDLRRADRNRGSRKVTDALCAALGDCAPNERQALLDRLSSKRAFVYVRRQVSPEQARRVGDLQLEGVGFMKESRRFYPNKELASHVLGYVGIDNTGLGGIESAYDSLIKGRPGTILIQTDAKRRPFSSDREAADAGRHARVDDRPVPSAHRRAGARGGRSRERRRRRRGRS